MLKGEAEFDPANEEGSAFDTGRAWQGEPLPVVYNAGIPPEFFDFIIVDECHRSIYKLWRQVLLYFDAFLIGLTATPAEQTIGFFNQNLVMQYGHEQAVTDGVNVDFDVYRIRTRITEQGATIDAANRRLRGQTPQAHPRRAAGAARRGPDLHRQQLDRDVVAERPDPDRHPARSATRCCRDLPRPREVPKTLIFAKDDSHADDIVRIVREEFAQGQRLLPENHLPHRLHHVTKKVKNDDGTESEVTNG